MWRSIVIKLSAVVLLLGGLSVAQINLGPSGQIQVKGQLQTANGGLGWSDTTFTGNSHKLVTSTGSLTTGHIITIDSSGNFVDGGAAPSGMVYPSSGLAASTGSAWRAPTYSDVFALFTGCSGTQYPGADGNCHTPAAGAQTHTITIPIAGAPIATGQGSVGAPGIAPFSCTINTAEIVSPVSGSITVEIWKAAGAIPTSGNKISASAPVTLSSAAVNTSSSLSGWTTSVSANDVFWATVATADGVLTNATVVLVCQ